MSIEGMLLDLPSILDETIVCAGREGHCRTRPVVRHPQSGLYYCSGDAWTLMKSSPEQWGYLSYAIEQRHKLPVIPIAWDAPVGEMGEPIED